MSLVSFFLPIFIGMLIILTQYLLSKIGRGFLGAILPLILLGIFAYRYFNGLYPPEKLESTLRALLIGMLLFLITWGSAREAKKKKREKEMEIIRAKNL